MNNAKTVAQNTWVGLWTALPKGLDQDFKQLIKDFSCNQKLKTRVVCKTWRKLIESKEMGEKHLRDRDIKPSLVWPWPTNIFEFLQNSQTIVALDFSLSMLDSWNGTELTNLDFGFQKALQIIADQGPELATNGVDCIVFGGSVLTAKVFSVEAAERFFLSQEIMEETNFDVLFNKIFEIQKRYLKQHRILPTNAHIISDFADDFDSDDIIEINKKANVHFECHRLKVNNPLNFEPNGLEFQEDFLLTVNEDIEMKIMKAIDGKSWDAEEEEDNQRQIVTRSVSKKRAAEKSVDCTFSVVNPKEFRLWKKQKR